MAKCANNGFGNPLFNSCLLADGVKIPFLHSAKIGLEMHIIYMDIRKIAVSCIIIRNRADILLTAA